MDGKSCELPQRHLTTGIMEDKQSPFPHWLNYLFIGLSALLLVVYLGQAGRWEHVERILKWLAAWSSPM